MPEQLSLLSHKNPMEQANRMVPELGKMIGLGLDLAFPSRVVENAPGTQYELMVTWCKAVFRELTESPGKCWLDR